MQHHILKPLAAIALGAVLLAGCGKEKEYQCTVKTEYKHKTDVPMVYNRQKNDEKNIILSTTCLSVFNNLFARFGLFGLYR